MKDISNVGKYSCQNGHLTYFKRFVCLLLYYISFETLSIEQNVSHCVYFCLSLILAKTIIGIRNNIYFEMISILSENLVPHYGLIDK